MARKRSYVRVTVSIPQEELKKVDRLAKAMMIPRSAIVRLAIVDYVKRAGGSKGREQGQ